MISYTWHIWHYAGAIYSKPIALFKNCFFLFYVFRKSIFINSRLKFQQDPHSTFIIITIFKSREWWTPALAERHILRSYSCDLFGFDSSKEGRLNTEEPDWTKVQLSKISKFGLWRMCCILAVGYHYQWLSVKKKLNAL